MELNPQVYVGKTLNGWSIDKHLGGGGFGHVFVVSRKGDTAKYAMKLVRKAEVTKTGKIKRTQGVESSALAMEYRMYTTRLRQLAAVPKLAKINSYGNANPGSSPADEVRFMVMEMCNRTLSEVLKKNPQGVPFADVAQVGLHVLSVLKELHLKGFVYVDIKTDNIMVGNAVSEHQAFLLDYGCTQLYRTLTGPDKFQAANANGTAIYVSAFAHGGQSPHPRNDLQSLAYLMAYLANGSLPWQFEASKAQLIEQKLAASSAAVAGAAPAALKQWLDIVGGLPLGDPALIPYDKLQALLAKHAPTSGKFSAAMLGGKGPAAAAAAASSDSSSAESSPPPKRTASRGKRAAPKPRKTPTKSAPKRAARSKAPVAPLDLMDSSSDCSSSDSSSSSSSDASPSPAKQRVPARTRAKRARAAAPAIVSVSSGDEDASSDSSAHSPSPVKVASRTRRPAKRTRAAAAAAAIVDSSEGPSASDSDSDSSVSSVDTAEAASPSLRKARRTATTSNSSSAASSPRSVIAGVVDDLPDRRTPAVDASDAPSPTPGRSPLRLAAGVHGVRTPGAMRLRSKTAEGGSSAWGNAGKTCTGIVLGGILAVSMTGAAAFLHK